MSELHGKEYFDYYVNTRKWNPTVKGRWQANYAEMIERVFGLAESGARVLDVGGASGSQASAMRDIGIDVWVIEPERYFVEISPFENMRGRILHAPAQEIPFRDGWFDFIHCSQVLEHIPENEVVTALSEIRRVLKPSGMLFATLPVDWGMPQPEDDDVTHCTILPMDEWLRRADVAGLFRLKTGPDYVGRLEAEPMWQQYRWDYFMVRRYPN